MMTALRQAINETIEKLNFQTLGSTDNASRWYPSERQKCSDCDWIRSPSRAYPWSLWKHCQSNKHTFLLVIEAMLSSNYKAFSKEQKSAVQKLRRKLVRNGTFWQLEAYTN